MVGGRDPEQTGPFDSPWRAGARIDRFVIREAIGSGAMGVVLAAHDPDLDRDVAIKVISTAALADSDVIERFLREARAMAKLNHPNIATIHEVGYIDDDVYIVMELVDGQSLRDWLAQAPRSADAVLPVLLDAARGLAAAHAAGLVHRDFKPSNVMLSSDGRVRVIDFGLARVVDEPVMSAVAPSESSGHGADPTLTRTGAILGTPAYMAPEQHRAELATPASDQFAFCVSLYEALYGVRPFPGDTYEELAANILDGRVRDPVEPRADKRIDQAILRGLSGPPEDRFTDMNALIGALEPKASSNRMWLGGALALLVVIAGLLVAMRLWGTSGERAETCSGFEAQLHSVWDEPRRRQVQARFAATQKPYAAESFERVTAQLDSYGRRWVQARTDACRSHERGEQSDRMLDARMRCLDRRMSEMRALVDVLTAESSVKVLDNATNAAAQLMRLEHCEASKGLANTPALPEDPTARRQVKDAYAKLASARAHTYTGRYAEGLALAEQVAKDADALAHQPLQAEARYRAARLHEKLGKYQAAEASYRRAAVLAGAVDNDWLAARVWSELLLVVGDRLGRPRDALMIREAAESAAARTKNAPDVAARLHTNLGSVHFARGKLAEAEAEERRAVAAASRLSPNHPLRAHTLNNLGIALGAQAKLEAAAEQFRDALQIYQRTLGTRHPMVAVFHANLGLVRTKQRRFGEARTHYETSLAIRKAALGDEHVDVALTLNNIAMTHVEQGQYAEAEPLLRRTLEIWQRALGPDHMKLGFALESLSVVYANTNRPREALLAAQRALSVRKSLGPDHHEVADGWVRVAEAHLVAKRHAEALAAAEKALAILEGSKATTAQIADAKLAIARALALSKRSPARMRAMAKAAHAYYRGSGDERRAAMAAAVLATKR